MTTSAPPFAPPPVEEIERRLKWRVLPTLLFVALLTTLLVIALVSLLVRPRHPKGLPDDAGARAAAAALAGRVPVTTNALRWSASILGGEPPARGRDAAAVVAVARVRPQVEAAHRRHAGDPRSLAALAALDLVAHDYARAAQRYRRACEMAPHYSEARLGAGVALALEADRTAAPWQSRALRLQAIAEFAMVDATEREYPLALYDRARVLADVGRFGEANVYAARYWERDPRSPYAQALRALLASR